MMFRCVVRATAGSITIAGLFVLIISGCATAPQAEPERLVWPAKPLPARIEFVRSIVSDEDLGKDTTFTQSVVHFLSGEKPAVNRVVEPMGLAVSDDGQRVYVSDYTRLAVYIFDFEHKTFKKIGEPEVLQRPMGIALDAQEQVYVVEQQKKGIGVFDRQGKSLRFITDPSIERPAGIAIDRERGKIYLADTSHTKSDKHNVKVFTMDGKLTATIGTKGTGPGQFLFPTYVALDPQGNLYVTDTLNSRVQVFDPDGKYLKTIGSRGNGWGNFDKPKGVALDSFGNVYVADSGWSNVQIFNQKGQVLIFFGGRGPLPGMLKNPTAVAIDKNNRIYVADYLNHRVEVYQLVNTTANDSFLNPPAEEKGGNTQLNRSTFTSSDNTTQDATHETPSSTSAEKAHN
jgi:DNA-binding beta-propeller fold protein YncE